MAAGFERSLGATAIRVFGAAGEIGGKVEGGGGGERDRARGGVWPGWVARPWPSSCARRPQGRDPGFSSRSAARAAASAAGWRGRGRTPKGRGFRLRPLGRPGRRRAPGRRRSRPPRPDRPPLRKPSGWMRGRSGLAEPGRAAPPRRRIRPGSRLGGRPAPSRHSERRFAAGPSGSPTAKRRSRSAASSALRRRILAEAAALCSASRARSAPAAGGSARRISVEKREAGAGGKQRIALPCPSARPRPGRDRPAAERLAVPGFSRARLRSRALRGRRRNALVEGLEAVGEEVKIGANHLGMVNPWRRFVTCLRRNPPRLSWGGNVR